MSARIFPIRNCWVGRQAISPSTEEAIKQASQLGQTATFSAHPGLDAHLTLLHRRILEGDPHAQVEVDRLIVAELLLRTPSVAKCVAESGVGDVVDLIRSRICDTPQLDTMPDLGSYIQSVVFFSGNQPPTIQLPNCLIYLLIYEALPNIKRTKQMKNSENSKLTPMTEGQASACVSSMTGTLLGLFDHAAKRPGFQMRCSLYAELHRVQCLTTAEKEAWLLSIPNVVRLCFMEFVLSFIVAFMPVEAAILHKRPSTAMYLKTYATVCDSFRQSISEGELDIFAMDAIAQQHIDRCMRMCKFKMCRHSATAQVTTIDSGAVTEEVIRTVLQEPVMRYPHQYLPKTKGRHSNTRDFTHELRILYPHMSVDFARACNHIQQIISIYPLPRNIAQGQWTAICRRFSNCSRRAVHARKVHLCLMCCLHNKTLQSQKFRFCMTDGSLECTHCNTGFSVLAVDLLGFVMYYSNEAYFLCTHCARLCKHNGEGEGFVQRCAGCLSKPKQPRKRARTCCARCDSTVIFHTMELLQEEIPAMRQIPLCFKHTPTVQIRRNIVELKQLAGV